MDTTNSAPESNIPNQNPSTGGQNDKVMGILAYLSILVLVPLLSSNKSESVKFHTNQGLVLLVVNIIGQIILSVLNLYVIIPIFSLAILALVIVGIMHVVNGEMKELPLIGGWKILK